MQNKEMLAVISKMEKQLAALKTMVLASEKYETADYIRDYNEFLKYKGL